MCLYTLYRQLQYFCLVSPYCLLIHNKNISHQLLPVRLYYYRLVSRFISSTPSLNMSIYVSFSQDQSTLSDTFPGRRPPTNPSVHIDPVRRTPVTHLYFEVCLGMVQYYQPKKELLFRSVTVRHVSLYCSVPKVKSTNPICGTSSLLPLVSFFLPLILLCRSKTHSLLSVQL